MSYELNKKIRELEPYEPISGTYKILLDFFTKLSTERGEKNLAVPLVGRTWLGPAKQSPRGSGLQLPRNTEPALSSFIYYTEDALRKDAEDVVRFAETEGLTAHANSIKVRFDKIGRALLRLLRIITESIQNM